MKIRKLFYEIEETDKEATIVYKNYAIYSSLIWLSLVLIIVSIFLPQIANFAYGFLVFILLLRIIAYWKIGSRVRKAMKAGKVEASGSAMSLKNPMTFKIKK